MVKHSSENPKNICQKLYNVHNTKIHSAHEHEQNAIHTEPNKFSVLRWNRSKCSFCVYFVLVVERVWEKERGTVGTYLVFVLSAHLDKLVLLFSFSCARPCCFSSFAFSLYLTLLFLFGCVWICFSKRK